MNLDGRRIVQSSHGFSDLDVVGFNSATEVFAKAKDAPGELEPIGLVINSTTNRFRLLYPGPHRVRGHGLTVGDYYLSASTAGAMTQTKPGYPAKGRVLLTVIDADFFISHPIYGITSA